MPTLGERIVEHLRTRGASLDDGELADALGVRRPLIAETCRELEAQGLVVRNLAGGTRPVLAEPASPASPRPVVAEPASPRPAQAAAPPAAAPDPVAVDAAAAFADHARAVLSARWGTSLQQRLAVLPGGDAHPFELVSGNGRIVGDIARLGRLGPSEEAKAAALAEAVLIVGHVTNAVRRFLVVGADVDTANRWLTRYRLLLGGVELWFLDGDRLERLA